MNESQQNKLEEHCLDSGLLASLRDGELHGEELAQVQAHLATCPGCTAEARSLQSTGHEIYALFSTLDAAPVTASQTSTAFARLQAQLNENGHLRTANTANITPMPVRRKTASFTPRTRAYSVRWLIAAVAALLLIALVTPNAQVLAQQFLSLFHVQQFQAVSISPEQVNRNLINDLMSFGTVQVTNNNNNYPPNLTQAQVEQYTHIHILLPAQLPAGVGTTIHFSVFGGEQATFVFNAQTTREYMQQIGDGNMAIPANLDGATYHITVAPGALITYPSGCQNGQQAKTLLSHLAPCQKSINFAMAELPSPVLESSGQASISDLRAFLLSLTHLPAPIHDMAMHVDETTGTVPVPMPPAANSQNVTINGANGILLTDSSFKQGAVLWQAHGIVYLLTGGTSDSTQLMAAANSLR